jgi:hypothetical protein
MKAGAATRATLAWGAGTKAEVAPARAAKVKRDSFILDISGVFVSFANAILF